MENYSPEFKLLIGTHHKTGTAWMQSIFREIAGIFSLAFCNSSKKLPPTPGCQVVFNYHSAFDAQLLSGAYRGIHLIRDPRDVIVSGCFYHQKSKEEWLHVPLEQLGYKTYQQSINEIPDLRDKLLFEMNHVGSTIIHDILKWNYHDPGFLELKYEELIVDDKMHLFTKIFQFLEFPEAMIPELLSVVRRNSIFSGQLVSEHIRSGKPAQWKSYFEPVHKERFLGLFGDALIRLGYENNNDW